ncbi:hypothetical protein EVAR_72694_1 [Eumeta japonica]|uniref:Uncharacterized protein n=1 Tax=Eumeta variegata TaxID=151549 RepID=A0A4C1TI73_EUMVA|nr:hypothetical protein EVAR_72694_1 [Eumeta japonica]
MDTSEDDSLKDSEIEEDTDNMKMQSQIFEENFNFPVYNSSTCWVCNGYYGPNFGEPLCSTCHAFLHNTEPTEELETTISDDEDSGNDEPPFKDKAEENDDDDEPDDEVDEVEGDRDVNEEDVEDVVDDVELEVDNDMIELPLIEERVNLENEKMWNDYCHSRPRPSATLFATTNGTLSEARANANRNGHWLFLEHESE